MQKNCFCRAIALLFNSKSDAFSEQKHCFFCRKSSHPKPLFIRNHAESTIISHNNNSFRSPIYPQKPPHLTSISFQLLSFYIHKSNTFASSPTPFAFPFHSPHKERRGKNTIKITSNGNQPHFLQNIKQVNKLTCSPSFQIKSRHRCIARARILKMKTYLPTPQRQSKGHQKRARKESIIDALLAILLYFFVLTQG